MYTHLLLISTVQFQEHIVLFSIIIYLLCQNKRFVFFINLSRHARMCNSSHHLQDATEKLFLHTIYSALILTDVLYFVLIYTKKGLFQWPSYRGEGILATIVKIVHIQKALRYRQNLWLRAFLCLWLCVFLIPEPAESL